MPSIDLVVETPVSSSTRARQVCSMFDVPPEKKCRKEWRAELPIDGEPWNVGLVVGPSGAGKSSIMRHLWGDMPELSWGAPSVIDDVRDGTPVADIADAFGAVGFNTIPAWLRPFHVLSNGEKFRVDLARRLIELPDPIVVDEFTSVVDRQVAQIGSHAVQKIIRKRGRRFVAVTCHYDVIDWLQPDWVFDVATMSFTRRLLQRRPSIECEIKRVPYDTWRLFAPYHYLSSDLHRAAKCWGLHVQGRCVAFTATMNVVHAAESVKLLRRISRTVTLPDWQGLGLSFALNDALGAAYAATGRRLRNYPSHPGFVRAHDRSRNWQMAREPGKHGSARGSSSSKANLMRPCAVFEYVGPAMPLRDAERLLAGA